MPTYIQAFWLFCAFFCGFALGAGVAARIFLAWQQPKVEEVAEVKEVEAERKPTSGRSYIGQKD